MTSGIYVIRHEASGRVYIGQSQDIEKRWNNHRTTLNRDCHHNKYLQRCWNKYGSDEFVFEIVDEEDDLSKLSALEERRMLSVDKKMRLNLSKDTEAAFRGLSHSEETKRVLSEKAKLRRASSETKEAMSRAQKCRYSTVEGRRARSEAARRGFAKLGALEKHRRRQKRVLSTPTARKNNSDAQKEDYQKHPERREAARQRMVERFSTKEARIAYSRKRGGRPVISTDLKTGKKKRYDYLESVKEDGFDPGNVKKVILGKYKHHKRRSWCYEE